MTSRPVPDFAMMAQSAQQAKIDLAAAQAALTNATVEGFGGDGVVRVVLSGSGDIQQVAIASDSVDPGRLQDLSAMIVDALRDAQANVKAIHQQQLGPVVNSLRLGLGGVDR